MADLDETILRVLDSSDVSHVSAAKLIDELDREAERFDIADVDEALAELQSAGEIRIRKPSSPLNEQIIDRSG